MMKKIFLCLVIVCISLISKATTYFVSNAGNDSNTGLSTVLPWQTLTKVNSKTFVAGDQILFQRGDTFYGSLTISQSGTSVNSITFGAYGTGANPVITGFTTVSTWTNLGSNIWESTNVVSTLTTCNVLNINGVNTSMGRYPNSDAANGGYLNFQSHTGYTSITSSSLTGTPNWTGAEAVIHSGHYIINRAIISSQAVGKINYPSISPQEPIDGFGFFIQNDVRTLDKQGEWYYNPSTKKIRIYSTSQPVNVNVASVDKLVTVTANYLSFEGITFQGANIAAFWGDHHSNILIKNCSLLYSGISATNMPYMTNITYEGNTIREANSSAIIANNSTGVTIRNNYLENIGIDPGMRKMAAFYGTNNAISADVTNDLIVEYNTIKNTGYNAINFYGNNVLVKNNFCDTFCTLLDDGGAIYSYTGTRTAMNNVIITGNITINGIGVIYGTDGTPITSCGIYLDERSKNVEISYNSVADVRDFGILLNTSAGNINVHHNTIYNASKFQYNSTYWGDEIPTLPPTGNQVKNNIFVAKIKTGIYDYANMNYDNQKCINLYFTRNGGATANDLMLASTTFDNNYYARPIADDKVIRFNHNDWNSGFRTLAEWKTYSGQDANSKKSAQAITSLTDFQFEYNASKTAKTVTLTRPMIDVKGAKYVGSITLQPFTSLVLMKDAKPAKYSTEYKSICDGLNYNGWTTTGKYERTVLAKSGVDSIITTYLTVNPKYAVQEDVTIKSGESYKGWNTSGTYTRTLASVSGCDSVITTQLAVDITTVKVVTTQSIQLKKGNNMISTYLQATNPDVSLVAKTIRDSGNLVKMQNESGSSYENWGTLGGWINNLGSIQNTEGYKIMVANDCVLQVTGTQIDLPLNISLNVGWNIISFPRADILDAQLIIQSLIDQNSLVKVQDEIGNSIEDWGIYGGWKNGIGNFLPGKAYRVKVSKSAVLSIQDVYPKSVAIPVYAEYTNHFSSVAEGNGSDHMNINLVGLSESGLSVGDELAAFDGDFCVGTLKITDQHLVEGSASLIASCSTDNLKKNGFIDGSSIQLQVWNHLSGIESGIHVSVLRGSLKYLKNDSMLGKLKSLTTSVTNLENKIQIAVFPNPSHGRFTVSFSDIPVSGSRIDVLDLSGRRIASRLITGITEELDITGQAAGMYLVKSILGLKENINKLVIQ